MTIQIWQRIISLFVYMLPLSDVLHLGSNLFAQYPILNYIIIPILPIIFIKTKILLGGLLLFLCLFFGVVKNTEIAFFIRFNTMQALLLNIAIIIGIYVIDIIIKPLGNYLLVQVASNIVFITTLGITIFAITKCVAGKEPDIPIISDAVRIQI
ncbi:MULTISPECIES: Tic20 family protein [Prochlorococcus]|uniref:Tic20 family protein n=1 Tax=Prochlorococcus TaxID=1218 RepID=UPI0005337CD5|nr:MULTISPECIES: Tic20 family protein [Prochlorococcus]KGG13744.1 hypothetical protein EV05_0402 [Prochlorococcus sp. MIT 0601]